MTPENDFISEEDLHTFEGWLRYQQASASTAEELETWHRLFEEARKAAATASKVGLMKLQPVPGESRYAVALRDGRDLWLTLWVRRSRKGEFFIMTPRGDRDWDPHTSYHLDGTLHMKSFGVTAPPPPKRQPLTGIFRGAEHLGAYYGHGKGSGAICDPSMFDGIVEVPAGVLGPRHGGVTVDLVEPHHDPASFPWNEIVIRQIFTDAVPWVVLTVGR
jgi:hypothetical protein